MDLFSYLLGKKNSGGGSGGLDWSALGYEQPPQSITNDYNYAKQIYDNWDSTQTNLYQKFRNDKNLVYMPLVDTSNAISADSMFYDCTYLEYIPSLIFSNIKVITSAFFNCGNLREVPQLDTSNVTNMRYLFTNCTKLETIPQLDTSKVTNLGSLVSNCPNLTDESLDNILKMCINVNPDYAKAKTLSDLGLNSTNYPTSRIQALPSYQDFITAGWTIGY